MRKAQIFGQVLIFVLALIVTAAILIFGFKAIQNLQAQQQKIELIAFQNNLKQAVEDASYGSSKRVNLVMPTGYSELCLIDKNLMPSDVGDPYLFEKSPLICEDWMDESSENNAFLLKSGSKSPTAFYAGNLSVDGNGDGGEDILANLDSGFLCIKPSGGSALSMIIEGRGRHALIRK